MSKAKQSNWKNEYLDSIRGHGKIPKRRSDYQCDFMSLNEGNCK